MEQRLTKVNTPKNITAGKKDRTKWGRGHKKKGGRHSWSGEQRGMKPLRGGVQRVGHKEIGGKKAKLVAV